MPGDEQKQRLAALDEKLKGLREAFWKERPGQKEQQIVWERSLASEQPLDPSARGECLHRERRGDKTPPGRCAPRLRPHKDRDVYTLTSRCPIRGQRAAPGSPEGSLAAQRRGRAASRGDQNVVTSEFTVEYIAQGPAQRVPVPLQNARADFEQEGWKIASAIDGNPDTGWAWAPQNAAVAHSRIRPQDAPHRPGAAS